MREQSPTAPQNDGLKRIFNPSFCAVKSVDVGMHNGGMMMNDKPCDMSDTSCFNGSGICATENAVDDQWEQCEHVEHGMQCEHGATGICDTCGAVLCNEHTFIGHTVVIDGMNIPYTYCPSGSCADVGAIFAPVRHI